MPGQQPFICPGAIQRTDYTGFLQGNLLRDEGPAAWKTACQKDLLLAC